MKVFLWLSMYETVLNERSMLRDFAAELDSLKRQHL